MRERLFFLWIHPASERRHLIFIMSDPVESSSKKRSFTACSLFAWAMLFVIWVILSGKIDLFHLGMGVLTVVGLIWLHRGLDPLRPVDSPRLRIGRMIIYFIWLFKEMILSALFVAREILRKDVKIKPQLLHFEAEQPTVLNAVIFGHSITLTPGTITLDLEDNRYLVHALTDETARGVLEGSMSQKVAKLSIDDPLEKPRLLTKPEITELWT